MRPANPAHQRIEKNRAQALAGWEKVATALDSPGDRELAQQVREFMQAGQAVPRSRNQLLYDTAMARPGQATGRSDDELER